MAEWQDTMERLVRDRERALLGYAFLVCGDSSRAQDLVQDALVRTFTRERKGLTVYAAESYVRRAITSVFIDEYRRSQRWDRVQHLFQHEEPGRDPIHAIEAGSDVHAALATLSPRERACVVLRYFDDLTVPQISRHLGLAEGTVKRYLADAVGRLQLALGELEAEDETTAVTPRKGSAKGDNHEDV